ncbi:hypothetical protein IFM89_002308 [Coptis chinensis]|uniref:Uncharacterized protein n=1 Tax=Coptis chinensis TaxID=261450 RepID=A0A835IN38_9MAGN|nr:hypothetical protein IFM89_002308 [Coptis chinensis]
MYSQCGQLKDMEKIVDEIDARCFHMEYYGYGIYQFWFLTNHSNYGEDERVGVDLNEFSSCARIDTCSYVEAPLVGEQIHARIKKLGLGSTHDIDEFNDHHVLKFREDGEGFYNL